MGQNGQNMKIYHMGEITWNNHPLTSYDLGYLGHEGFDM